MLSEDILHYIFRQYLDAFPQSWLTLVSVCQKWRQIIFTSPRGLNIRLHCTYKTPVLKALCLWPPGLPITIQYGGAPNLDPPAPEDDNNIIAALKQSGRVSSISLTVTSSLREKLSAISEPFTQLEDFVLFSQDTPQLNFPSSFHLGPCLRTVHMSRIAIPSIPRLLSPSQFLVDIQLHEIPITGYFSPDAFVNALSGTTQIRSLSLHFLSLPPRRNYLRLPPPPGERIVLPALICLKYRGTSKYLDSFVARIDAPHLGEINIIFFYQPTIDASQLGQFIERTEIHALRFVAKVETSADSISISFARSTASTDSPPLRLQISCKRLDWQLSCMAQICDQFSLFLFRLHNLVIDTTELSSGQGDVGGDEWVGLIRAFSGAKTFWVNGMHPDILGRPGGHTTNRAVAPKLLNVRVDRPMATDGPLRLQSFIVSQAVSEPKSEPGHPLQVGHGSSILSYRCHICRASFKQQQGLKRHLRDKHAYQIVCAYCNDFKFTPENDHLFRKHLESKHPAAVGEDSVLSDEFSMHLPLSQLNTKLDSLADSHSSLLAPVQTTSYPFQTTEWL